MFCLLSGVLNRKKICKRKFLSIFVSNLMFFYSKEITHWIMMKKPCILLQLVYIYTCRLGNIECCRKCKLGTPKSSPFHYTVSTQSLQRSDRDHHHRQFVKRNQSNCSSIKFLKIIDRQGAIKHFSWSQSILTGLQAPSGRDWLWTWPENQKELKKERLDRWWWSARQGRL